MRIGIIGNGVVGRATAFAWKDHCVLAWDAASEKSQSLLIDVCAADLIFVCVPEDALDDLFAMLVSGGNNGQFSTNSNLVIKSTCPVGTTSRLAEKCGLTNVVHSPEFLTERTALWDACNPSRIIVGESSSHFIVRRGATTDNYIDEWKGECGGDYATMCKQRFPGVPIYVMTSDESEFVKLACNAIYAAKVSLFNELRSFADAADMDWDRVLAGILSDGWTGSSHTRVPGPDGERGFGGRCLPKDLDHLRAAFNQADLQSVIMDAVKWRNENIDRRPS